MSHAFEKYGIIVPDGTNGQIKTSCPECQHQRKNHPNDKPLSVNVDEGTFKCHHCGWSGKASNDNWHNNGKLPKTEKIYRKPENVRIVESLPDLVTAWFWSRKITLDVIKRNKITHGQFWFPQAGENGQHGKQLPAIQFPYFDGEEIINVKARRDRPVRMFAQSKDAKPIPYKLNDIRGQVEFGLCEGETDCLSWEVAGFKNFCSSPGGAINPNDKSIEGKLRFLEFIQKEVEDAKWIYIATDNDEPGRRFEQQLSRRLGKEKCKIIRYPDDCKDANETLVKHGAEKLKEVFENAEPCPIDGLINFRDITDQIGKIYLDGYRRTVSTGIKKLDKCYTIREGEITVITGIPSHGKTAILYYIITHLARVERWRIGIYSPEHHPLERLFAELAKAYIKKPFHRGPTTRMDMADLQTAIIDLDELIKPILPKAESRKLEDILKLARVLVLRYGIKGLVLDPWNSIDHNDKDNEAGYISRSLTIIQDFSRINDLHIWIVAHPKLLMQGKDGTYYKPTLYSISGGANWKNRVDNGIVIWRDMVSNNNLVEFTTEKIKYSEVGRMDTCLLAFDPATGSLYDHDTKYSNVTNSNGVSPNGVHVNSTPPISEPIEENPYDGKTPEYINGEFF